jgi:CDP-diacylglycerol--glycerol-3-phosphate 3-phosphatidyltransferase
VKAKSSQRSLGRWASEIYRPANLLSLSRILLTPFIGYYLWKGDDQSTLICAVLLIIAGITDGLDGFLARRLNQVSRLGVVLDPLADKVFAAALVVMLIFFRGMPVWLAIVIVGRDLLLLAGGILLLKGKDVVIPSNLTGKYTFGSIAVLLGSYVIRFDFGITLFTYVTVALIAASTIAYVRIFLLAKKGIAPEPFVDRSFYRGARVVITIVIAAVSIYKLYQFLYG